MIDCASILIVIAIFVLKTTSGLICYDSLDPRPKPNQIVECSAEMMCYSEYYALNRSGELRQYFDRFCVHQKQCTHRGIDQECQSLEQLDIRIQRTFFKYHHSKPSRETLVRSRFCCCDTDRCNSFDNQMALAQFGISGCRHSFLLLLIIFIISVSFSYL